MFTFGGVGPEDLVRAYVVLFATAIAFGSIGLFVSALVKRTQAATVINLVTVIALTAGTAFIFVFWSAMTGNRPAARPAGPTRRTRSQALTRRPPEALLYFNPFVAQLDVICGTETGFGGTCQVIAAVTDARTRRSRATSRAVRRRPRLVLAARVAAMLVAALVLIVLSVQLVSPTRRWRIRAAAPTAPARRG